MRLLQHRQVPQRVTEQPRDREVAYTVCSGPNGQMVRGSEAEGPDRYSVRINVVCPHGYKAIATYHTHPGGVPVPSQEDLRAARQMGLAHICIGVPETGQVKCFNVRGSD